MIREERREFMGYQDTLVGIGKWVVQGLRHWQEKSDREAWSPKVTWSKFSLVSSNINLFEAGTKLY